MARIVILLVMLTTLVSIGVSQKRVISREEFAESYTTAIERSKEFPRIHDSKQVATVGGEVRSFTWKWVYAEKFSSHLKFEEKTSKGVVTFEMITIAENTFCKIGGGEWTKTQGTCDVRGPWMVTQMSWMMESAAKSEFFAESIVNSSTYSTRYTEIGRVPKRTLPSGYEAPPRTYESVFVTDEKGRIVSQEYTSYESGTKKGPPKWVDSFDYNQTNLKIEAPQVK